MKVEKALEEIEQIVRKIDPIQLYQSSLSHQLQNIVRKVRRDLKDEDVRKSIGSRTF
jgi:hypothetical protein